MCAGGVVVASGTGVSIASSLVNSMSSVSTVSSGTVSPVGGSTTVVAVTVDARVGSICSPVRVRSMNTLGVIVAGHI